MKPTLFLRSATPSRTPSSSRKKVKRKGKSSRSKATGEPSALDLPSDVFDAIAGAKGDTFNLRLDKAAKKMRLNRTQAINVQTGTFLLEIAYTNNYEL